MYIAVTPEETAMNSARHEFSSISLGLAATDRRESDRIPGPFDAWRIGLLQTPVRLYDISLGGCFVHAMHEQRPGVVVLLRVQIPNAGLLDIKAESIYSRPGFGFAVRFIDMDDTAKDRLALALEKHGRSLPS
jgi:hypothetical protein